MSKYSKHHSSTTKHLNTGKVSIATEFAGRGVRDIGTRFILRAIIEFSPMHIRKHNSHGFYLPE